MMMQITYGINIHKVLLFWLPKMLADDKYGAIKHAEFSKTARDIALTLIM